MAKLWYHISVKCPVWNIGHGKMRNGFWKFDMIPHSTSRDLCKKHDIRHRLRDDDGHMVYDISDKFMAVDVAART